MYHRRYIMFMHVLYVFIRDRHPVTPRTLDSACRETESLYAYCFGQYAYAKNIRCVEIYQALCR